jgi:transcriptional regulator with XRE-family HTH domain
MSRFAAALKTWMSVEHPELTLRQLSGLCGLSNGDLSRVRDGSKIITFTALTKLAVAVRNHYGTDPAVRLVIAYLWDEVPTAFQEDISIEPSEDDRLRETAGKQDPLESALQFFRERAAQDNDFAEWIIRFHTMITEERPGPVLERRLVTYRTGSKNQNVTGGTISGDVNQHNH